MAMNEEPLISSAEDGTPVFAGTTILVSDLFPHLAEGGDLAGFLTRLPSRQARATVLLAREAADLMLRHPERLRGA